MSLNTKYKNLLTKSNKLKSGVSSIKFANN